MMRKTAFGNAKGRLLYFGLYSTVIQQVIYFNATTFGRGWGRCQKSRVTSFRRDLQSAGSYYKDL